MLRPIKTTPILLVIGLAMVILATVACDGSDGTGRTKQDPATQDPATQDPVTQDPATQDPKTKQPAEPKPNESVPQTTDRNGPQSPDQPANAPTIEIPSTWKRLSKKHEIWIDSKAKQVIVGGTVCLDQGPLEMFMCPEGTKEHESIIAANALSSEVHASLLAIGTDPGKPSSWDPEYRAAFGPTIEVTLKWQDPKTKKTRSQSAKQWIRDIRTKQPMSHDWVFGGSQFWTDPDTKEQVYYGDAGEMICLSNFSTATIDVNVESSQSNDGLLFEAFTENIPPIGTRVYAILKPGKEIKPEPKKSTPEKASPEPTDENPDSPKSDDGNPPQ